VVEDAEAMPAPASRATQLSALKKAMSLLLNLLMKSRRNN
jgi:hypothetical protein